MNRYIVNEFKAIIPSGMIIMLDEAQYSTRRSSLKILKKGRYEVVSPVEFKRGEVIGLAGEIKSKMLAGQLDRVDEKAAANAGADNPLPASALPA